MVSQSGHAPLRDADDQQRQEVPRASESFGPSDLSAEFTEIPTQRARGEVTPGRATAASMVIADGTETISCLWCGCSCTSRRSGGSPQRFCPGAHRAEFWSALRRWGERAVAAGG